MGMRTCRRCHEMLPVSDFYQGRHVCKYCIAESNRVASERRNQSKTPVSELLRQWKRPVWPTLYDKT